MKLSILKKRIMYVSFFICFSLGAYGIIGVLQNVKSNRNAFKTSALPITNKVVIIDAGHGKPDEGAVGFNGTTEQALNLSIALKLQKLIEQSGAKVILTRSDENGIYSTDTKNIRKWKVSDTRNRVEIGNNSEADIFVSIHLNKYPPSQVYKGWQVFYQKSNAKSQEIAGIIQENLNKNIEKENHRVIMPISNIYIMEHVQIPTVIVECGFLSNPEECEALKTDTYQNKIVWGIYTGLQEYFLKEGE